MTKPDLESLAGRATAGDRAALDELCRHVTGPVYRLALRMLGRPADAEDAAQEILVLVVTHLAQFQGRSAFLTWVYTIAARHLLRTRRRRAEEQALDDAALAAVIDAGLAATTPGAQPAGDARLLAKEVRMVCTQAMLLALSREERLALILVDVLGADDPFGAEICEVAPAAFRQRLSRARGKLRPILEERCGVATRGARCDCARQVLGKQALGLDTTTLRWARHPAEAEPRVARAHEQLAALVRRGRLFDADEPLAAPATLRLRLVAALPELLS